jgi:trimeric autotransporter adhesin
MKTKPSFLYLVSFVFCLSLCPSPSALSQIPQGFNYQAIVRDGTGAILSNTSLQVMFYVQSLQTGGTLYWKELHSSVTTNNFGLFNLVVGNGVRQTESTAATFNLIDWKVTPKFLKTEIYYSSAWHDLGTSQLMTVPYAMVAEDLAGSVAKLSVKGETSGFEDALFEVKNKNGQTIFAVYNEGVRIYVDDGAKGPKGGFAVGGFDMTKATKREYLIVSDDSVRIYLDNDPLTKKLKGGFAVGGYDMTKATDIEDYLQVTRDSTRIYVNEGTGKAVKGGFAVGGFDMTKGTQTITPFTTLKPDNYFIGHRSGEKISTGIYNSVLGYESGISLTSGFRNSFFGYQAGSLNTTGYSNVFLGNMAGYNNIDGVNNVFLGDRAGYRNDHGGSNVFIGEGTGFANLTGNMNVFLGERSGESNTTGANNVFLGTYAGLKNVDGYSNIFIGSAAGNSNISGLRNIVIGNYASYSPTDNQMSVTIGESAGGSGSYLTALGSSAGYQFNGQGNVFIGSGAGASDEIVNGERNVFIGFQAGRNVNCTQMLYINNYSGVPLIGGDFSTRRVGINCLPTTYTLEVNGTTTSITTTGTAAHAGQFQARAGSTAQGQRAVYSFYPTFEATPTDNVVRRAADIVGGYNGGSWGSEFLSFNVGNNSAANDAGNITSEKMRITSSGNIGILNSAPTYNLDVNGTGRFMNSVQIGNSSGPITANWWEFGVDNGGGTGIDFHSNITANDYSARFYRLAGNNGELQISNLGTGNIVLQTQATARMIITSTGLIGIGTTTASSKLDVSGMIRATSTNVPTSGAGIELSYSGGVGVIEGIDRTASVQKPICLASSNVYPQQQVNLGNSSYRWNAVYAVVGTIQTSDLRMKENILPLRYGIEALMQLKPVSFNWKNVEDRHRRLGLIAQDVLPVISEIVDIGTDPEATLGINYSELTPVLIKAIQEQQQQIESTKQENQQLRSELQSLKDKMDRIEAMLAKGEVR